MLTLKDSHKRFADKYFETLNGSQSAIYAGYAEASARIEASRLLAREDVQDYLQELAAVELNKHGITKDRVLQEAAALAFSDIRNYYDDNGFLKLPKDLTDEAAAALAGIEIDEIWGMGESGNKERIGETKKIKVYDKPASLEKLFKYLGMYEKDNSQTKATAQVTIFQLPDNGRNSD